MVHRYYAHFFNRLTAEYDTLEFSTDGDPYVYFWRAFPDSYAELTSLEIYLLTPVRKVH